MRPEHAAEVRHVRGAKLEDDLGDRITVRTTPRHHPFWSERKSGMAIHPILKMGDPRLLRVAQPVREFDTPELHALIADLFDTMRAAQGAGLAAPQIGVDLQVVIFGFESNERYPDAPPVPQTVLINPVIEPLGPDEEEGWEGCLSVPGLRGVVPRWARIRYRGFDQRGAPIEREAEGFHARVVQHECDHLIGKLYPMRVRDFSRFGFTSVLFPGLGAEGDD
jgi:peptide deformylase